MKIFLDTDNINVVQPVTSAYTAISSIATEVKDFITSKFSDKYFKNLYIDTSETIIQANKNSMYNNSTNKIPYPSLKISPEISLDDPIGGMQKSLHMSSPNLYIRKDINRSYKKVLIDPEGKFSIHFTSDYATTNFNCTITTNSYMQNVEVLSYIKSGFQNGFFQYLNDKHVTSEIPKAFIKIMAKILGYNLDVADEMDQFRLYLIGSSMREGFIQKRTSLATGKECFFVNENVNLLTLFTDLDAPGSIIRNDQVEGEYNITFRFQVSTWLPNAYIFSINKTAFTELDYATQQSINDAAQQETGFLTATYSTNDSQLVNIESPNISRLSKKYTTYFVDDAGNNQIGINVYNTTYTHDMNVSLTEYTIPILTNTSAVSKNLARVHSYACATGTESDETKIAINLSSLFYMVIDTKEKTLLGKVVYDDADLVDTSGEYDYVVNLTTMTIKFVTDVTYDFSVSLYVNRTLYESINKAIASDKFYFDQNYLTNIILNVNGTDDEGRSVISRGIVKSFVNSDEMYSTDITKALRIYTEYGIGYVSLEDKNPYSIIASGDTPIIYQMCVGYNGEMPIIQSIEIK